MNLLDENDPFLKIPVDEIDISNLPDNFDEKIMEMIFLMNSSNAIGLAAVQVGLPWRVFVMKTLTGTQTCINPKIIESSNDLPLTEGCLSFPDLRLVVHRPNIIEVTYLDQNLALIKEKLYGIDAVVFSHELDHLNGITFDTRVSKFQLKNALKKRKRTQAID